MITILAFCFWIKQLSIKASIQYIYSKCLSCLNDEYKRTDEKINTVVIYIMTIDSESKFKSVLNINELKITINGI